MDPTLARDKGNSSRSIRSCPTLLRKSLPSCKNFAFLNSARSPGLLRGKTSERLTTKRKKSWIGTVTGQSRPVWIRRKKVLKIRALPSFNTQTHL